VVAVEEDPALMGIARAALDGSGVTLVEGPLIEGHAEGAPYDLIIIDGAVEFVPDALIGQLVDGGRVGLAILAQGVAQIALGRRAGDSFGVAPVSDVATTILPGFSKPRTFTF
jgi:protein-L-isoaspartate(D-aspartate) O-methyltransferase